MAKTNRKFSCNKCGLTFSKKNKSKYMHHISEAHKSKILIDYDVTGDVVQAYKFELKNCVKCLPEELIDRIVDDYLDVRDFCSGCEDKCDNTYSSGICRICNKAFCDLCEEDEIFEKNFWNGQYILSEYYCLSCKESCAISRSCYICNKDFDDDTLAESNYCIDCN